MEPRDITWSRLDTETFDLLIIGGGINGCGALRDAVRRGLKVLLVEAEDLASGTSSRSSKLIHGGLRYLENREFSLVFEAVSERRVLRHIAPHLVNSMGFLFPIYDDSVIGLGFLKTGLWVYEGLSLFRSPHIHRNLRPARVAEEQPILSQEGLKGAPLYWDCSTDDARLTLENALDGLACGGELLTYTRVTALERDETGRVCGARVHDCLGNRQGLVKAKVVLNATGPWTDRVRGVEDEKRQLLRPTKGVHLVVDHERLPLKYAVVCYHPEDERILFAIPWGTRSYVGTTDTDYEGDPADVAATAEDVHYLLRACARYFPEARLGPEDVMATWAGLRPLVQDESSETSSVSREHEIVVDEDGLVTICGGKLTTYRKMADQVVDTVVEQLEAQGEKRDLSSAHTRREPLPGAVGLPENDDHDLVAQEAVKASGGRLEHHQARYLVDLYGTRGVGLAAELAGSESGLTPLPGDGQALLGQVDWSVQQEVALTLSDVLIRRTQLFFRERDQGLEAAPRVADRMAELLGWSPERREAELSRYRGEVGQSRRWNQAESSRLGK